MACRLAESSDSSPSVSVFLDWSMARWPADHEARIERLRVAGVDRVFVSIGGSDMPARIAVLAEMASSRG